MKKFKVGQDVYYIDHRHSLIMLYRITEIKEDIYHIQYHPERPGIHAKEYQIYSTYKKAFNACKARILEDAYSKIDDLKNKNMYPNIKSLKVWF